MSACGEAPLVWTVEVEPEVEEAETPSVVEGEAQVSLRLTPPKPLGVPWAWPRLPALAQRVSRLRVMVKLVAQLHPSVQVVEAVVERGHRRVLAIGVC